MCASPFFDFQCLSCNSLAHFIKCWPLSCNLLGKFIEFQRLRRSPCGPHGSLHQIGDNCLYFASLEQVSNVMHISDRWYLLVFYESGALFRPLLSVRVINTCLLFTSVEQLSEPLHRSWYLIFACILQVLSTYPIPFIGQDDWYLLLLYKSGAIIRPLLSVRIIDIWLYFTSLEQLSDPLRRSGQLVFACIFQGWSNYPTPVTGQDDWCLLVFYTSWAIIRYPLLVRVINISLYFTSLEQLSDPCYSSG